MLPVTAQRDIQICA